jgi:hypothetical protein
MSHQSRTTPAVPSTGIPGIKVALAAAILFFTATGLVAAQVGPPGVIGGFPGPSASAMIWGVNGHAVWYYPGATLDQQMSMVRDLGMTYYRVDVHPNGVAADDLNVANNLALVVAAAKRHGVSILVTITPKVGEIDNETEASYYKKSYNAARSLVLRFKNDVHVWELDNEVERYAMVRPCETLDNGYVWHCDWGDIGGTNPGDYISARYNRLRGDIRGLSDGIASADATARRIVNVSAGFHYGFLQRLINDGVKFEIIGPHWYSTYGDIQDPNNNIAKPLAALGKPIWITEFNRGYGSYHGQEAAQGFVIGQMATEFCYIAKIYNIQAAFVYELLDESYYGDTFEAFMGLINLVKDKGGNWVYGPYKPAFSAIKTATALNCPFK